MQLIVQVVVHFPIINNPLVTHFPFNIVAGSPEMSKRHVYSYGKIYSLPFLSESDVTEASKTGNCVHYLAIITLLQTYFLRKQMLYL